MTAASETSPAIMEPIRREAELALHLMRYAGLCSIAAGSDTQRQALLSQLVHPDDERLDFVRIGAGSGNSIERLHLKTAEACGLEVDTPEEAHTALRQSLVERQPRQHLLLILLENAEQLPAETLKEFITDIQTLDSRSAGRIALMLLGTESLRPKADQPPLSGLPCHVVQLAAATPEAPQPHAPQGRPTPKPRRGLPLAAGTVLAAAVITGIAWFALAPQEQGTESVAMPLPQPAQKLAAEAELPSLFPPPLPAQPLPQAAATRAMAEAGEPAEEPATGTAAEAPPPTDAAPEVEPTRAPEPASAETTGVIAPTETPDAAPSIEHAPPAPDVVVPDEAPVTTEERSPEVTPDAERTPEASPAASPATEERAAEVTAVVEPASAKAPEAPSSSRLDAPAGPEWYAGQPPQAYTLQLIGLNQKDDLLAYAADTGLPMAELAYYRVLRNGKPLYLLTFGNYADKAAADAASRDLPPAIQRLDPWPRSMASIQKQLDTSR